MKIKDRHITIGAKILSSIFSPFYLPVLGMVILFLFSYLKVLPLFYKLIILALVYCFTVLIPMVLIKFYYKHQGWTGIQISAPKRRAIPYLISSICYLLGMFIMGNLRVPHFMVNIILSALIIQLVCAILNIWWNPSNHSAGAGGIVGALLAFANLFSFNPLIWFSILIIISGAVGSSRIILHQHTVMQVFISFLIGAICANLTIMFL